MMMRRHLYLALLALAVPALAGDRPQEAAKETVTLRFRTTPRVKARVLWGKKLLGETPLTLKWPRDSGPLDVVIRARDYLPVHTRVYTFSDDSVHVKLVREADKKSVFGYREPPPPPPAPPDGGVPDGGTR
jgi:hypothetical protein